MCIGFFLFFSFYLNIFVFHLLFKIVMSNIITLNSENIASEHICCAFADKKCAKGYQAKKDWLIDQFNKSYIFKKLDERGKVFIEYSPAETSWAPIDADGYNLINCFWVSGKFQGLGWGKKLYQKCYEDSLKKNGIVIISSRKKMPFLSDKKFFEMQGFKLYDTAEPYFELWGLKLSQDAPDPKFKDCCKEATCNSKEGLAVYYTNACPFTEHYVNIELPAIAERRGLKVKITKIETIEQAQNHFVPFTIHSIFLNGKFVTHQILTDKSFDKFVKLD